MGKGQLRERCQPERSEVLWPSCVPPAVTLIEWWHRRNMGPSKNRKPAPNRSLANVDAWSIRILVILQGMAIIAAILAGSSLKEIGAISEGWLKVLELVARAG